MRKCSLFIFLVYALGFGQNKQVLYDFAGLPQTLILNPGAEVENKYHFGLPLFSQISAQAGFTGFSTYDIFADNGININDKIRAAVNKYGTAEFVAFNQQLEVLSGGFRLPNNDYLSFGFYEEVDFLAKIPRDMVDLFYEGNTVINRRYTIKKLTVRAEMVGVLHAGLSKKIDEKWNLGARAKIYSGVFNLSSKSNSGAFYTEGGTQNIYRQHLDNVDFLMQTSGVIFHNGEEIDASYVKSKLLFGGNLGFGIDVGFTHHYSKQWTITGSILDVGFINNSKNVESFIAKGDYQVEGVQLSFDPDNPENYWGDLKDDFDNSTVLDTIYKSYISFRPVKLNGSASYSFGRKYDDCRFLIDRGLYVNKMGFQLFSTVGAVHSYVAGTLFYERWINKYLQAKLTYTADPYSFSNVGLGLSANIGIVNLFFTADNLLSLNNIYSAKSASFQIGLNFIFKDKN